MGVEVSGFFNGIWLKSIHTLTFITVFTASASIRVSARNASLYIAVMIFCAQPYLKPCFMCYFYILSTCPSKGLCTALDDSVIYCKELSHQTVKWEPALLGGVERGGDVKGGKRERWWVSSCSSFSSGERGWNLSLGRLNEESPQWGGHCVGAGRRVNSLVPQITWLAALWRAERDRGGPNGGPGAREKPCRPGHSGGWRGGQGPLGIFSSLVFLSFLAAHPEHAFFRNSLRWDDSREIPLPCVEKWMHSSLLSLPSMHGLEIYSSQC